MRLARLLTVALVWLARSAAAPPPGGSLIGMHYEPWFTPHNISWKLAEAKPVLGFYSSYDLSVIEQHERWFEQLGIDWLLVDWSNMLWMKPRWERHQGGVRELEETTRLLLDTYCRLAAAGNRPPKTVLLLALQNGPPVRHGMERLNRIVAWITDKYLAQPQYRDLWLTLDGKPLLVVWYSPYDACRRLPRLLKKHPLIAPAWTIRWMNQQLQITKTNQCGMWSWIDGTIRQRVTFRNGAAEHVVVTPACFPPRGWTAPGAVPKDHGVSYLESWRQAFRYRPQFVALNQWNEFAGQPEGHGYGPHHEIYLDEYSATRSDDLEPTALGVCGYRGCEPWGFYYVNLTRAALALYRDETPGITVLAQAPVQVTADALQFHWAVLGAEPASFSLFVDGRLAAANVLGDWLTLPRARFAQGRHQATVVANQAYTYFDLNPERMTARAPGPLPVESSVPFVIERPRN